jgi:PAS domain S-box-containing protein
MADRKVKHGSEEDLGGRDNQLRQARVRPKRTVMPRNQPMSGVVSWAQIRKVFDSLPIRIALLDLNYRHCYVNPEWSNFFGIAADATLGRTIADVLGEETFESVRLQDERALTGETAQWGGWVEDRFGRRYVRRTCAPLRDAAGTVKGYFVFSRDLT